MKSWPIISGLMFSVTFCFCREQHAGVIDSLQHTDSLQVKAPVDSAEQVSPPVTVNGKFVVDEDRIFDIGLQPLTVGERESTDVALGNFPKEQTSFRGEKSPMNGSLTLGYGSYSTPLFDGWWGSASGKADVLLRVGYKSTDGQFLNRDYRSGHAGVATGVFLPETAGMFSNGRLSADATFQGQSYRLYGSVTPARLRSVNRFSGKAGVDMKYASGGYFGGVIHLNTASVIDSVRTGENYAGMELSGGVPIDRTRLKIDAGVWRNFLASPVRQQDPYFTRLGLQMEYQFDEAVRLNGGATMFNARGSDGASRGVLFPNAGITWFAAQGLTLFGKYEPFVQRTTVSDLVRTNPYLGYGIRIQNAEYFQDFTFGTGVEVSQRVKAKVQLNYKRAHAYPIFMPVSANLWDVQYSGTTQVLSFEAEAFADVGEDGNLGATLAIRNGTVFDLPGSVPGFETSVPYLPQVTFSGSYQHRFPFGLVVGSTLQYIDRQHADLLNTHDVPAFARWDMNARYTIGHVSAGVDIENILDQQQQWWEHYPGELRRVLLSVGFTW